MCSSWRNARDYFGSVDEGFDGGGEAEGFSASGTPSAGALSADTDLSAREREGTSTVSSRSLAKRVIAKSFACTFSPVEDEGGAGFSDT